MYFTSCGSEGDNWALISGARYMRRRGRHIISSAVEHDAVRKSLDFLENEGYEITRLKPDGTGAIPLERVRAALRPDTILVSLMMVNNETGAINDIAAVARMLKAENSIALLHTDAVQGFLKVPFSARTLGADMITISGHKIHAPKGIGALYIRSGLKLPSYILGGGQERGMRAGTEANAADRRLWYGGRDRQCMKMAEATKTMAELRAHAIDRLTAEVDGLGRHRRRLAAHPQHFSARLPERGADELPRGARDLHIKKLRLQKGRAEPCTRGDRAAGERDRRRAAHQLFALHHAGRHRRAV